MSKSSSAAISKQTTLRVRDACLCLHVQRAARALARRFDDAFRPLGLTSGQFSLMMSLNRPEPPNMAAIASFLAMDRTTLTAALKPLERRGLVAVGVDPTDRRSRRLALTDSGRCILAAAVPLWERTHAQVADMMDETDADTLRAGLRALSGDEFQPRGRTSE